MKNHASQRRSVLGFVAVGAAALVISIATVTGAVSLHITGSTETANGSQDSAQFLVHWQQTGQIYGAVPAAVPTLWSGAVGTPTVLPGASSRGMINAGTAGHTALEWRFSETVGISVSTEIELDFTVHYTIGTTASTFSTTIYLETQAAAIVRTLTYTLYFDAGTTAAVDFASELEVAQVCAAVGTCP